MSQSVLNVYKHTFSYYEINVQTHKYCMLQVTELATVKNPPDRLSALQSWQREGGVMIMGYEMYRILSQGQKNNEEWKKEMKSILVDPGKVTECNGVMSSKYLMCQCFAL